MREQIHEVVGETLRKLQRDGVLTLETWPGYSIDAPKKAEHGDFATNVAMVLAKPERKKPRDIAQAIVDGLVDEQGLIAAAEIAGPGFINFRLQPLAVLRTIKTVLESGEAHGRAKKPSGQTVNVEFVSANPTGPLHLGHARGAFMGDAVARLLEAAGHKVTREFYINDSGKQVLTLGRSVHTRYRELFGQEVTLGPGEYPAPYVIDIAKALKARDGDKWLNAPEEEWLPVCTSFGIAENLKGIKQTLEQVGIRHDIWFSEQDLHDDGSVKKIVQVYKERGETYDADEARGTEDKKRRADSKASQYAGQQLGGTFLETSKYGDEEDRIILRHDGTPVYLTADLAYHHHKAERGYDRIIDVWGADHAGHVPRIKAGMQGLGHDVKRFEFLLVQIVRLMRGGEEVRISKRTGELYELSELVSEVGQDPVRFIFLMRAANTQFDFDLELAVKQSNDNPVFYCQMGHARCVNVLKKADAVGQTFQGLDSVTDARLERLVLDEERLMAKKMADLAHVVQGAAQACEPHRVLFYAQDLIADFHSYFTKYKHTERIVSDDKELTQARLALVAALRQVLANALTLLGISAPEWMEPDKTEPEEDQ